MTTTDAVTSAHLLKSTPDTFDLDADFAAQMRYARAASSVDVLEASAQRREAREFAPHPDLAPELAALLNQHNVDVDQRKANGEQRRGGWTYLDRLEATQENKR